MKARKVVLSVVFATTTMLGLASPASAAGCEPADPNCNVGCQIINRIFKDSCQT